MTHLKHILITGAAGFIGAHLARRLELAESGVGHMDYACSSSVYGANARSRSRVHDSVDHPLSTYAATKTANELMAHAYAALYGHGADAVRAQNPLR